MAFARITSGGVLRARKRFPEATHEYEGALSTARRLRIPRMEAEAQSEFSRLDLALGDSEEARQRALASLRISNRMGLGLRQVTSLVVLGLATAEGGQRDFGIAYLRHAYRLAKRQEYRLRAREAEEHLQRLGEAVE